MKAIQPRSAIKQRIQRFLLWSPRILSILFAMFISIFACDVFGAGFGFWQTMLALLMHLIPTILISIAAAAAWRWAWTGAVIFPSLGGLYIHMTWGSFPLSAYVTISGPLFLLGLLFLMQWMFQRFFAQ